MSQPDETRDAAIRRLFRLRPKVRDGYCPWHPNVKLAGFLGCSACWSEDPR